MFACYFLLLATTSLFTPVSALSATYDSEPSLPPPQADDNINRGSSTGELPFMRLGMAQRLKRKLPSRMQSLTRRSASGSSGVAGTRSEPPSRLSLSAFSSAPANLAGSPTSVVSGQPTRQKTPDSGAGLQVDTGTPKSIPESYVPEVDESPLPAYNKHNIFKQSIITVDSKQSTPSQPSQYTDDSLESFKPSQSQRAAKMRSRASAMFRRPRFGSGNSSG